MTAASARVDVLTAEVRTLMVGSRQVTLSVYRQLDEVQPEGIEPFGRVRDKRAAGGYVEVVGRSVADGSLVRAVRRATPRPDIPLHGNGSEIVEMIVPDGGWLTEQDPPVVHARDGFAVYIPFHRVRQWTYPPADTAQRKWRYLYWREEDATLGAAETLIAAAIEVRDAAAPWEALPLIVLAGLR